MKTWTYSLLSAALLVLAGAWLALFSPLTVSWEEPSRHIGIGATPPRTVTVEVNRLVYQWILSEQGAPPWGCVHIQDNTRKFLDISVQDDRGGFWELARYGYTKVTCWP